MVGHPNHMMASLACCHVIPQHQAAVQLNGSLPGPGMLSFHPSIAVKCLDQPVLILCAGCAMSWCRTMNWVYSSRSSCWITQVLVAGKFRLTRERFINNALVSNCTVKL